MSINDYLEKGKAYFAIAVIGLLEAYALSLGIDGVALSTTIGLLAGLGGYLFGTRTLD